MPPDRSDRAGPPPPTAPSLGDPELFSAVAETAADYVSVHGPGGETVYASPSVERLFGWKPAEVLGRTPEHCVHPDDLPAVRQKLAELRPGRRVTIEFRFLCADGSYRQVESASRPYLMAGEMLGFVCTMRDVTEQRRAEATAQRYHRALRTLSQSNEALVRATDERALLDAVCRVVVEVGGYRMCWVGFAEQDAARKVVPVAHAGHEEGYLSTVDIVWSDTDRGRGPVGTAVRTGKPAIARDIASDERFAPWLVEAAKRGYASVAAFPLVAEKATLGALSIYAAEVGVFEDEEMELLLELANDLAFGIAALRGREERARMTAQLMQADRLVAAGTLAAGVAHEINNPLAYLIASLDFLDGDLAALERELRPGRLEQGRQALADAREGASRVRQIVRDLKTFSRADEERTGQVDLRRIIESAINMAFNEIKHRARLVRQYGKTPLVLGNEGRLGQVFLNLLVNAAQAIREGHADENEIRVVTRTDALGRAIVEVRDSGAGIAPENKERVFDPFFTTKPVGIGTGLGLSICRNIVAALGGEISVESESGQGTAFRVALPPAPAGSPAEEKQAQPLEKGRRGRVLVVDDELTVGFAIRRVLAVEHEVTVLTSAREARDRIGQGERFDALVCDVMMPDMTGMDLHVALEAMAPDQAARMLLITGGAFTPDARRFLDAVPNPRIEKPFDSSSLRALVRGLVG